MPGFLRIRYPDLDARPRQHNGHASRVATEPDQENHLRMRRCTEILRDIDRVPSPRDVETGAKLFGSEPVVHKIFSDIRQGSIFAHTDGHGKQRKGRVHERRRDERLMKTAKRHAHTPMNLWFMCHVFAVPRKGSVLLSCEVTKSPCPQMLHQETRA